MKMLDKKSVFNSLLCLKGESNLSIGGKFKNLLLPKSFSETQIFPAKDLFWLRAEFCQ